MNMISSKMYPIHKLNSNVTKDLQKIISADIKTNVQKGLQNEIKFIDECSHITNVAEIKGTNDNAQVYLSSAFCQFLWLINDIALKQVDFEIIQDECLKVKANISEYKKSVETILKHPKILYQVDVWHKINVNQYFDYLKRTLQLLDNDKLNENIKNEWNLAISLLDSSKSINIDDFNGININGLYEQLVNKVYCYGIAFILLHELSHFELGHLDKDEQEMQDEIDADYAAFWNIYNDLNGRELFSANIGILCALFSLLMRNPKMEDDDVHPKESDRIFSILDLIDNENPKYKVLVDKLFKLWAKYYNIQGFPYVDHNLKESLSQIRSFMNTYKR